MKIRDYPYYNICFTTSGYAGTKDFDNTYLGFDNYLKIKPTVKLEALFFSSGEVDMFTKWWESENEVQRGKQIFMADILFFGATNEHGEPNKYGIEQLTPLQHKILPSGQHTVSFDARIMFDINDLHNTVPLAHDKTVTIEKNTQDNFIKLSGTDFDYDPIEYEVQVCPAHGTLSGNAPTLLYTPDPDYVGADCFSYVTRDYWVESIPAVVDITVGEGILPKFMVKYNVSAPFRITGNFFWTFSFTGDQTVDKWHRGFGGYLDSEDPDHPGQYLPIFIASDDHIIDERDDVITDVNIIKWGDRTDYTNFLALKTKVVNFSEAQDAGECKGILFNRMFAQTTLTSIPIFSMIEGVDFTAMFANSKIEFLGYLEVVNGVKFTRMFYRAAIEKILSVSSTQAKYFEQMFEGADNLVCIGELDTRSKAASGSTENMFKDTPKLQSPATSGNGVTQQNLMDGAVLTNTAACGVQATGITQVGTAPTCKVGAGGSACTSTGTYKVAAGGAIGPIHYKWTVSGGTIVGDSTKTQVQVSTSADKDKKIYLTCVVTDDHHTTTTGSVSFMHRRTYTDLHLTLPKSYSQINLRTFINSKDHGNIHKRVIITNNVANCSITTGNLSGLTVTLINNSTLDGFAKSRTNSNSSKNTGLSATSAIILINNGAIRGAGGYGGKGGKGKNTTYNVKTKTEHWDSKLFTQSNGNKTFRTSWQAYCDSGAIRIFMDAKATGSDHDCTRTGPYNSPSSSHPGKLTRGKLKMRPYNQAYIYSIMREHSVKKTRSGGAGGMGGGGAGYNKPDAHDGSWRKGSKGKGSSPSGGYSGGTGGYGGYWGSTGQTGKTGSGSGSTGQKGYDAAPGITGKSYITMTKQGNVKGDVK